MTFFHSIPAGCKICVNLLYQALKCLPIIFLSAKADEERALYMSLLTCYLLFPLFLNDSFYSVHKFIKLPGCCI
jgi:hypothetical protein